MREPMRGRATLLGDAARPVQQPQSLQVQGLQRQAPVAPARWQPQAGLALSVRAVSLLAIMVLLGSPAPSKPCGRITF